MTMMTTMTMTRRHSSTVHAVLRIHKEVKKRVWQQYNVQYSEMHVFTAERATRIEGILSWLSEGCRHLDGDTATLASIIHPITISIPPNNTPFAWAATPAQVQCVYYMCFQATIQTCLICCGEGNCTSLCILNSDSVLSCKLCWLSSMGKLCSERRGIEMKYNENKLAFLSGGCPRCVLADADKHAIRCQAVPDATLFARVKKPCPNTYPQKGARHAKCTPRRVRCHTQLRVKTGLF